MNLLETGIHSANVVVHETDPAARTLRRIESGQARIAVIGLGYVGLPLVTALVGGGYTVLGIDIDPRKVEELQSGRSYIRHVSHETVQTLVSDGIFEATTDMARISEVDAIIICVPTPLNRHREPDLSHIVATTEAIAPHLGSGQLLVLESTTYPGTTRDVMRPILEQSGLHSNVDFFLAYSPEREDPGNDNFRTHQIPKVVGGDGLRALELARALYSRITTATVPVSSLETAEAVKLTENIFRAVNIALVNELKVLYDAMDIDIWEVVDAARTKPFGYMPFYPGPGLGGHCLPIDPFYLTWKAHEYGISTRFIELAGEINTSMPVHVINRLATALDTRSGRGLKGARILMLGIAYKKDVEDTRESPALRIMSLLESRGASVDYHDPYVPAIPTCREYPHLTGRESVPLLCDQLAQYAAVLICTDHSCVNYQMVRENAALVVDTRNCCRIGPSVDGNVVRA